MYLRLICLDLKSCGVSQSSELGHAAQTGKSPAFLTVGSLLICEKRAVFLWLLSARLNRPACLPSFSRESH
uniref:Uncharacterized protein n=1 Tax=Anguilla anguilla TaxID=7936 RepID=A0A0E9XS67_ANGAN